MSFFLLPDQPDSIRPLAGRIDRLLARAIGTAALEPIFAITADDAS
jgi:hypothetical protein